MATSSTSARVLGHFTSVGWWGVGLASLGIVNALLLVWGSAPSGSVTRQLTAVICAAVVGGSALLWIALDQRFERMQVATILGLALLLRLIATQASPLLEDDHFRYLWDGLRTATSFDPYRLPPSAFFGNSDLPPRWQDILGGINNPDIQTIYGPLLQWVFALAWWIAPGQLAPLQALLMTADMTVLLILVRQGTNRRWLLAYAVHPLILKEVMACAHPDGLVALTLLLALVAWQRRHAARAGAMLGLAVGTKVAALVALPLLLLAPTMGLNTPEQGPNGWRWALRLGASFAATLALLYGPFVLAGGSDASALGTFGSQWRFNPLLYRLIETVLPVTAARPVAALLIVAGIAAICWRWWRNQALAAASTPIPLDAAFVTLLLLSPVLNPWYWLWALALSVHRGRFAIAITSVIAVVSYFNSSVLLEAGWVIRTQPAAPYLVPWPLALLQVTVLLCALLMDAARTQHHSSAVMNVDPIQRCPR